METILVGCVVWVLEVFSHPLAGEGMRKKGWAGSVRCGSAFLQHSQTCLVASPGGAVMVTQVPLVSLNVQPFM